MDCGPTLEKVAGGATVVVPPPVPDKVNVSLRDPALAEPAEPERIGKCGIISPR